MELVSVQYDYEYKAKDGRLVSIKPNESYILVSKTNEHWWHVRKDQHTRPFYVPAQYVKELPSLTEDSPGPNKLDSPECVTNSKPAGMANTTPASGAIKLSTHGASRETYRFSTFGFCEEVPDIRPCKPLNEGQTTSSFAHTLDNIKTHNSTGGFSSDSASLETDDSSQLYAKPHPVPKVKNGQRQSKSPPQDDKVEQNQTFQQDEDMDFPLPPDLPVYDSIPEINVTQFEAFPELPDPDASDDTCEQQSLTQTSCTDALSTEQVKNESLRSAVYVNVAELRQSISESPPSGPSSYSPSYLDPEGWEVHVDEESGQEYYYHPTTGRTTWDNPFLDSPTDPESLRVEETCSPSPTPSPLFSPSTASPPSAWTSDWEELVDETSGRPYFYNPMSGETSWEPPEQLSPYPPLMEPMSVHRFHEDGPPPLPEEDYPPEDYPTADQRESYKDLLATGPSTLPKEYTFSHVSRTVIPRANLDRSTPAGWTLTVDPNGTWVFTSEHSPEQVAPRTD